jgi:hypothetical protein
VAYATKTTTKLLLKLPGTYLDRLQPAIPAEWSSAARTRRKKKQIL